MVLFFRMLLWQVSTNNVGEKKDPVLEQFVLNILIKHIHMGSPAPKRKEQRQGLG